MSSTSNPNNAIVLENQDLNEEYKEKLKIVIIYYKLIATCQTQQA